MMMRNRCFAPKFDNLLPFMSVWFKIHGLGLTQILQNYFQKRIASLLYLEVMYFVRATAFFNRKH